MIAHDNALRVFVEGVKYIEWPNTDLLLLLTY